jgi:plasmid stabilization system protein ParE
MQAMLREHPGLRWKALNVRKRLGRFPYVLFYRELSDNIEVTAVAHGAREPGYWLKRK